MRLKENFKKLYSEKWVAVIECALIILVCVAAAYILYNHNPKGARFNVCAFKSITSLDCPGCGMTRAFYSMLHLDFARAVDYNLFSPLLAFVFVLALLHHLVKRLTGKTLIKKIPSKPIIILAALAIVFMIVRNIPVSPFTYLHS